MAKKAIVLNSGGLDTLVSIAIMRNRGWELSSLYFDMGQKNNEKAKIFAKQIADKYCFEHQVMTIDGGRPYIIPLPFPHIAQQGSVVCVMGAMYAVSHGFEYVVTGIKFDAVSKTFYDRLTDFLACSKISDPVVFLHPVSSIIPIRDVISLGLANGLTVEEMAQTISCNFSPACGVCHKCKERLEIGL